MAKRKPPTIPKLLDKLAVEVQRYVRLNNADALGIVTCVTCGKRLHWTQMHGGHFIGRRCVYWRCSPANIHPQCPGCNGPNNSDAVQVKYTLWMIREFGLHAVESMVGQMGKRHAWQKDRAHILKEIDLYKSINKLLEDDLKSLGLDHE